MALEARLLRLMRRLHHFPLSPFCRKIRLVLAEKKLAFESITERPWEQPPNGLSLPQLILSSGDKIHDSRAIAEFIEETIPTPPLLPKTPVDRATTRRLVNYFDECLSQQVSSVILHERVLKRFSLVEDRDPDIAKLKASQQALREHLRVIGSLADQNGFLVGQLSLADLTAAAHLSCIDYFGDVPWGAFPSASEWYARIKSRPSFRSLLIDNLPGFAPSPHYANLDF
jgi:glutathione S-transferase